MNAALTLTLARKHVADNAVNESSARLCLADAVALYDATQYGDAANRAVKSLAYSVGVFHIDYKRAAKAAERANPAPQTFTPDVCAWD